MTCKKLSQVGGVGWGRDGLNGYKANISPAKLKLADIGAGAELDNNQATRVDEYKRGEFNFDVISGPQKRFKFSPNNNRTYLVIASGGLSLACHGSAPPPPTFCQCVIENFAYVMPKSDL